MSTSYDSGVILGVKLFEIGVEIENISIPYVVHNRKGIPTGIIDHDKSVKITFQGKESIEKKVYSEVIEELINVKKPLIFQNISYDECDIDNIIIGINIVNREYDDWNIVKEISIDDKVDFVKAELKNQFGVDVEPKLYYYFQVS
jgi:hypothetical protein